jgi:DNA-binding MarR family transcriptional regulator
MYRFLLNKRYAALLTVIGKKKNLHELSRDVDMTISHLSNVTDQWEKEGMITKKRIGREVDLDLTEKGKNIVDLIQKFEDVSKMEAKEKNEGKD